MPAVPAYGGMVDNEAGDDPSALTVRCGSCCAERLHPDRVAAVAQVRSHFSVLTHRPYSHMATTPFQLGSPPLSGFRGGRHVLLLRQKRVRVERLHVGLLVEQF